VELNDSAAALCRTGAPHRLGDPGAPAGLGETLAGVVPHAVSCRALGLSQAWFYKRAHGDVSLRRKRRAALAALIVYLFGKHHGSYGSPRSGRVGWLVGVGRQDVVSDGGGRIKEV
jgi:hypothetical protein